MRPDPKPVKKVKPIKRTPLKRVVKKRVKKRKQRTIASLKKAARYYFQRWIRYRDLGEKCICDSCNNMLLNMSEFDAGHYFKAELYSNMIFVEESVNGQCKGCNGFRDGNIIEYRKGLVKKLGEEKVKRLEEMAHYNRETYKWDREFLQGIINEYKRRVQEIEENL